MRLWPFGKKKSAPRQRAYSGAQISRLAADWITMSTSQDAEARGNLKLLRNRCRELERNNDYVQSYLREVENNVIGLGISFQSQVQMKRGGGMNDKVNQAIQDAWWKWSKAKTCDVAGQLSFTEMEYLLVRSCARDGEIFFRKIRQPFGGSAVPFALEVLEADMLDEEYNDITPTGNTVRMGVERDQWGRTVAYYMFTYHPGDFPFGATATSANDRRRRIPAEEIIHCMRPTRAGQTRGIPWIASSLMRLRQMQGYEEAEVIAARASASIMGFIESPTPENQLGEDDGIERVTDFEPGTFKYLQPGEQVKVPDVQRPGGTFSPFMKMQLRSTAAGIGASYESLSKDYSESNYSSSRLALLTERDQWRKLQQWVLAQFHQQVYEAWLDMVVLAGVIEIPDYETNIDTYQGVRWLTRGWSWVDPQKEVAAYREAIAGGLTSATKVIAGEGGDLKELYQEIAAERKLAESLDLTFDTDAANSLPTNKPNPAYLDTGASTPA